MYFISGAKIYELVSRNPCGRYNTCTSGLCSISVTFLPSLYMQIVIYSGVLIKIKIVVVVIHTYQIGDIWKFAPDSTETKPNKVS